MTRYTCGFFPRILAIIPATRYTCVFLPRILTFFLTNAHIYAHKKAHIKQACGIWGHRKSSYKRHRIIPSAKTPSCTMELRGNFGLNQSWLQWPRYFERGLVLIHCPHSSDGCWLPDNEFVGIRGLSLERLFTLFHEC